MTLPSSAGVDVQQALREIRAELDKARVRDLDMGGRRVVNAARGTATTDYVTVAQMRDFLSSSEARDILKRLLGL